MSNKIFFFDISRIDVVKAVQKVYDRFPVSKDLFSMSKDENGDGFYLVVPENCPAEWVYNVGVEYAGIIQENNPFIKTR